MRNQKRSGALLDHLKKRRSGKKKNLESKRSPRVHCKAVKCKDKSKQLFWSSKNSVWMELNYQVFFYLNRIFSLESWGADFAVLACCYSSWARCPHISVFILCVLLVFQTSFWALHFSRMFNLVIEKGSALVLLCTFDQNSVEPYWKSRIKLHMMRFFICAQLLIPHWYHKIW